MVRRFKPVNRDLQGDRTNKPDDRVKIAARSPNSLIPKPVDPHPNLGHPKSATRRLARINWTLLLEDRQELGGLPSCLQVKEDPSHPDIDGPLTRTSRSSGTI